MVRRLRWGAMTGASLLLLVGSQQHWLSLGWTEVLGFVTGAACVLLVLEENIWNFPIGIANSVFFILLFLQSRLYGDMGLQVIYILLGFQGWYLWLCGGARHSALRVTRAPRQELLLLAALGAIATLGLTLYFRSIHDAAPFLDALTTVLSLVAQYLLNKKRIQNWWVWIAADVVYVGLYLYKDLVLTSALYALFILMCVGGLRAWQQGLTAPADQALAEGAVP